MYLNNHLIGSTPLKTEKIIEFNFVDGNVLKIQEDNVAILEFISFEVLYCASNPGIQRIQKSILVGKIVLFTSSLNI